MSLPDLEETEFGGGLNAHPGAFTAASPLAEQLTDCEGDLEVLWRYRQTEAFAILRTSYVDSDTDDTWFQTFHIGVRREF